MSYQPPLKKQKIEDHVEIIFEKSPFELLLQQDWFLIELGRKLIGIHDTDLLNILVLNKSISKRAIPIFKQHFLDISLQKELKQLLKQVKLKQIEALFEKHRLAINPNLKISDKYLSKHPNAKILTNCIHFHEVWRCDCKYYLKSGKTNLAVIASRMKLDSLVRMLLFHPKANFAKFSSIELIQLFDWAGIRGHLDLLHLIFENGKFRTISYENFGFDVSFVIRSSIRMEKFDVFSEILNWKPANRGFHLIDIISSTSPILFECFQKEKEGLKYFELLLNSNLVWFDDSRASNFLSNIINNGGDYFLVTLKTLLDKGFDFSYWDVRGQVAEILGRLSENFDSDKGQKIAAKLALITQRDTIFENILEKQRFNDSDLLSFIPTSSKIKFPHQFFKLLKLLLKNLSKTAKLLPIHVENLLLSCIQNDSNSDVFFLIWDDKRLEKTPEMIHKLTISLFTSEHFKSHSSKMPFLLQHSPLDEVEYNIGTIQSPEIIKSSITNCIWLEMCRTPVSKSEIPFKLEMTEELFILKLKLYEIHGCILFPWISLNFPAVKQEWWTLNRIHSVLLSICKFPIEETEFSLFLKHFPNHPFSRNNNEALRVLLESEWKSDPHLGKRFADSHLKICKELTKRIRFSSVSQRREFLDLVKLKCNESRIGSQMIEAVQNIDVLGVNDSFWNIKQEKWKKEELEKAKGVQKNERKKKVGHIPKINVWNSDPFENSDNSDKSENSENSENSEDNYEGNYEEDAYF